MIAATAAPTPIATFTDLLQRVQRNDATNEASSGFRTNDARGMRNLSSSHIDDANSINTARRHLLAEVGIDETTLKHDAALSAAAVRVAKVGGELLATSNIVGRGSVVLSLGETYDGAIDAVRAALDFLVARPA